MDEADCCSFSWSCNAWKLPVEPWTSTTTTMSLRRDSATDNSGRASERLTELVITTQVVHLRSRYFFWLSASNIVSCRYCRRITVDHRRQIYVEFQNQKEQNRKASKADLFSISSGFVEFTKDSLFSCAKAGCPYPISKRSIWCLNSWKQRSSSFSLILWCLPRRAKW